MIAWIMELQTEGFDYASLNSVTVLREYFLAVCGWQRKGLGRILTVDRDEERR